MEPILGQIVLFAGNFAPRNWAQCNGQLMSIAQNTALFSLFGTTYGGDGKTTFALPDLRGRIPSHYGQGPGLSPTVLGEAQGMENNTLNILNLPPHTHTTTGTVSVACNSGDEADQPSPAGGYFRQTPGINTYAGSSNAVMGPSASTVTIGVAGMNAPINNLQPTLAMTYIVCTAGVFPQRP